MQHKRKGVRLRVFMLLVALLAVVLIGGLMMTDIPAPQKPIEKQIIPPNG